MGAIETRSTGSGSEREAVDGSTVGIHLRVLSTLGVDLPETAKILDFGCGAGGTVRALRARGTSTLVVMTSGTAESSSATIEIRSKLGPCWI